MTRREFDVEAMKLYRQIERERLQPDQIESAIKACLWRQEYWRDKGNRDELRRQEKVLDLLLARRKYAPRVLARHVFLHRWSLIFSDPKDWLYEGDVSGIRIADIFERSFRDPLPEAPPMNEPAPRSGPPAPWLIPPANPGPFLRMKFPHEDRCASPFGRGVRCSDVMRQVIGNF